MQTTTARHCMTSSFIGAVLLLATASSSHAQQANQPAPPQLPETVVEAPMQIQPAFNPTVGVDAAFGDFEAVFDAPGSGAFLDKKAITTQSYDNVERVLSMVPGVYFRAENGFGHFPSISLRGVATTRSAKITVMEDGVLIGPAPYSAPAVYYFPNVGRMHAVEVIKGGSQILFGPHTTGGAINFLSTPIPEEGTVYFRGLYGSNNEYRMHAWLGDTMNTKWGRIGYVLEGCLRESDGFKTLNLAPGMDSPNPFSNVGRTRNTGFTDGDTMLKVFWEPNTCTYQRWDVKAGYTSSLRNETYLGISEADFAADPFQRYPASQFDHFTGEHLTSYLRYTIGNPETDWISITNTTYYNRFYRNWYKLQDLRDIDTDGDGTGDGVNMDLGSALAGAQNWVGLDVLRGQRAGTWRVRANNRDYYSYGNEIVSSMKFEGKRATHDVIAGFRYHVDEIRPLQHDDQFTIDDQGFITGTAFGASGSQRNREQETHATAFYAQDAISFGRWVVTPGVRFEHMHMSTIDYNGANTIFTDNLDVTAGGIGATYDVTDKLKFLAGFHRGFSPPSPRGATGQGPGGNRLHEEESLASEFGLRYLDTRRAFGTQLIAFYTHFNDLIVTDILATGGGTGNDENVGEAFASGLEFSLQYDPGLDHDWAFSNPWFLIATYTNSRLLNDVNSIDPGSLFAGGKRGNWMPYIPEWMFTMGTGVHFDLVGVDIRGIYVDDTYSTASNTTSLQRPDGTPDSRFGKTDEYFIWDLAMYARLTEQVKLFGGIQNVFDLRYLSSRHPYGPRPGAPFFGYMGIEALY